MDTAASVVSGDEQARGQEMKWGCFCKKSGNWGCFCKKSGKWGVFFVKMWIFPQRMVHYVTPPYVDDRVRRFFFGGGGGSSL